MTTTITSIDFFKKGIKFNYFNALYLENFWTKKFVLAF